MKACCKLREGPYEDGRIIYETQNFYVFSSLGSMGIPGYTLIAPTKHCEGFARMPEELYPELEDIIELTKSKLIEVYHKVPIMFEHGPKVNNTGWGGGSSIDHAHLHLIPGIDFTDLFAKSLLSKLDETNQFYRIDNTKHADAFRRAKEILIEQNNSYVIVQTPDEKRLTAQIGFPGESQWLRKLTAIACLTPEWNWRVFPHKERALRTAEELRKVFPSS